MEPDLYYQEWNDGDAGRYSRRAVYLESNLTRCTMGEQLVALGPRHACLCAIYSWLGVFYAGQLWVWKYVNLQHDAPCADSLGRSSVRHPSCTCRQHYKSEWNYKGFYNTSAHHHSVCNNGPSFDGWTDFKHRRYHC